MHELFSTLTSCVTSHISLIYRNSAVFKDSNRTNGASSVDLVADTVFGGQETKQALLLNNLKALLCCVFVQVIWHVNIVFAILCQYWVCCAELAMNYCCSVSFFNNVWNCNAVFVFIQYTVDARGQYRSDRPGKGLSSVIRPINRTLDSI